MKTILLAFFAFTTIAATAKNYYVSSIHGDDSRSSTQAQNKNTPWKTIGKLNSFFSSLLPGDSVLFERGSVFYGFLRFQNSGTSSKRIVLDAYGTGAVPVITGFTKVTSWKSVGSNIWESTSAISSLSTANMVVINGKNTPMGRYPNTGFLTYQSFSGNTSITSSSLKSSATNWTGAEVVIKKNRWVLDRGKVKSQSSGGTLTYTGGGYTARANYGFFIQNDSRTLDQQNEWYYNPSTKKIRVYSSSAPTNVQVSTKDTLIYMAYSNYITFNNLSFTGANSHAIWIYSCSNLTLKGCTVDFSYNGITGQNFGKSSANFVLQNSTINHSNNNAIVLSDEFSSASISNNKITNTALFNGAGGSGDGTYTAMSIQSSNCTIKNNVIDSVGYNGIAFFGNSINVTYNLVNNYCLLKSDGGGIYTQGINSNMTISGNVVINGNCKDEGVYNPVGVSVIAIYCDGNVTDIHVLNNSVANNNYGGIYLHNPVKVDVKNNTVYNCGYTGLLIKNDNSSITMRNLTVKNNIFFAKDVPQLACKIITLHNDISSLGTFDSNYYARPKDDNLVFLAQPAGEDGANNFYNLAQWKSYSHLDAHSSKSPKTITNVSDLRFDYNAGTSSKTVSLGATYIDVKGKSYPGSITLGAYSSAVLIKNNSSALVNQSPTANAGPDQTIKLPTNSVTLSGSGTDAEGTISYAWKKLSGPAAYTIANAASPSTTVSGLEKGWYQFELKITDNNGAVARDTVKIVVNSASVSLAARSVYLGMMPEQTLRAYPNPARSVATIQVYPAESGQAGLEVFDLEGRPVKRLFSGMAEAGVTKNFVVDAGSLSAGSYIIRFTTPTKVISQKIVLHK